MSELATLKAAAAGTANLMAQIVECIRKGATLGEIRMRCAGVWRVSAGELGSLRIR